MRRAVRNVMAQMGSQVITWIATLLLTAALGRYLGASGFGVLYLGLSFTAIFGGLVDFGLAPLISREVARRPDRLGLLLANSLAIRLALWLVALLGIEASAAALAYPDVTRQVLRIYALALGFTSFAGLLSAFFFGLERAGHPSIGSIVERVFNAATGIFLLTRGADVVEMAWIMLGGAAARFIWLLVALWPYLRVTRGIDPRLMRSLLAAGFPFVAYQVMADINGRIDAVMLSRMADEAVVGWYGAAYRLFESLLFLPGILAGSILLPMLSKLAVESPEKLRVGVEKSMSVLLLTGIPMSAGVIVLARPLLELVYGKPEFLNATPALQILALGALLIYINSVTGWAGVSIGLERKQLPIPLVAAVLNVAFNLVVIPLWQHVGAAVVTVVSEIVIGVGFVAVLPRWARPRDSLAVGLKATLAAAGMVAVLLPTEALLSDAGPLIVVSVLAALGAVVYCALVLGLRAVPREDLAILWQVVGRRAARPAVEGLESA